VVQVAKVDLEARRIEFRVVKEGFRPAPPPPAPRAKGESLEERRERQAARNARIASRQGGGAAPDAAAATPGAPSRGAKKGKSQVVHGKKKGRR
jgi:hypothetical protein